VVIAPKGNHELTWAIAREGGKPSPLMGGYFIGKAKHD